MYKRLILFLLFFISLNFIFFNGVKAVFASKKEEQKTFYNTDIDDLISEMTLEEKLGQILIFGFKGLDLDDEFKLWLSKGMLGNVKIFLRNVSSGDQIRRLTSEIWKKCEESRLKIPPFIATDVEGGMVDHLRNGEAEITPSAALISATGNVEAATCAARIIANNLLIAGINMNFAPCFDVLTNIESRVIDTRSFGSDPDLVYKMAKPFIVEQSRVGIVSVPKHFPGHGMAGFDSHLKLGVVEMEGAEIFSNHITPYIHGIGDGIIDACMVSNILYRNLDRNFPAVFSPAIIEGILRDRLNFRGIVVTDDLEMKGAEDLIQDPLKEFIYAFKAGADLFLFGHTREKQEKLIKMASGLFFKGVLNETELNIRVRRVLYLKKRYTLRFKNCRNNLNAREKIIEENYDRLKDLIKSGITVLYKKPQISSVEYFSELKERGVRGVVISPSSRFTTFARLYLPDWDIIFCGYYPSYRMNKSKLKILAREIKKYDFALLGFATERQIPWIKLLKRKKLNFALFIVDHPLLSLPYVKDSVLAVTSYDSFSPAVDALFYEVFYGGKFKGSFPYNIRY